MNAQELFDRHKKDADALFDASFFSADKILAIAEAAKLEESDKEMIKSFISFADSEVLMYAWELYYLLYHSGEDFTFDIWSLDGIAKCDVAEEKFPGCINAIIYLLAVKNLEEWLSDKEEFDKDECIEYYFNRYRYISELNKITYERFGLSRLAPFLYGYSKPFILHIGRLNYQYTLFKDYAELYEDKEGNRIFAALPNYEYNENGLQEEGGFKPLYETEGSTLTAHIFGDRGRLGRNPEKLALDKITKILTPGDKVATIHIPEGGKLSTDIVLDSLKRAEAVFEKYFPESKGLVCQTWFIDPGLRPEVIKDGSNLAAFADLFDIISATDNNNHSIFEHIFKVKRQPLEDLVPVNDFQRRVLDRALRGEKIYWSYGVLKKCHLDILDKTNKL